MKIDTTLDIAQNARFYNLFHGLILQMAKETAFTETDLEGILLVYFKFALANGKRAKYMKRSQILQIFDIHFKISDSLIVDRILNYISPENKSYILPLSWVKLLAIYMIGTFEEKMKFCFSIYDLYDTGNLNRNVVARFVTNFVVFKDEDTEELVNDMIDSIMRRMDYDRDGNISFEDYKTVVEKSPPLMEFLGQCIPHEWTLTVEAYCCNVKSKML